MKIILNFVLIIISMFLVTFSEVNANIDLQVDSTSTDKIYWSWDSSIASHYSLEGEYGFIGFTTATNFAQRTAKFVSQEEWGYREKNGTLDEILIFPGDTIIVKVFAHLPDETKVDSSNWVTIIIPPVKNFNIWVPLYSTSGIGIEWTHATGLPTIIYLNGKQEASTWGSYHWINRLEPNTRYDIKIELPDGRSDSLQWYTDIEYPTDIEVISADTDSIVVRLNSSEDGFSNLGLGKSRIEISPGVTHGSPFSSSSNSENSLLVITKDEFGRPFKAGKEYFVTGAVYNGNGGLSRVDNEPISLLAELEIPITTSVSDNSTYPKNLQLHQNYPNPFNPTTNIEFSLAKSGSVKLEIFNRLGQRVATLVNETKPAGTYIVPFDASGLTSGVYVYRLTSGGKVLTKRMIFLK